MAPVVELGGAGGRSDSHLLSMFERALVAQVIGDAGGAPSGAEQRSLFLVRDAGGREILVEIALELVMARGFVMGTA